MPSSAIVCRDRYFFMTFLSGDKRGHAHATLFGLFSYRKTTPRSSAKSFHGGPGMTADVCLVVLNCL